MFDLGEIIIEFVAAGFRGLGRPKKVRFESLKSDDALNYIFYQICSEEDSYADELEDVSSSFIDSAALDVGELKKLIQQCHAARDILKLRLLSKFFKNGIIVTGLTLGDLKIEVNRIADLECTWLDARNRDQMADHCRSLMSW